MTDVQSLSHPPRGTGNPGLPRLMDTCVRTPRLLTLAPPTANPTGILKTACPINLNTALLSNLANLSMPSLMLPRATGTNDKITINDALPWN